jgi:hypothetical protein
MRNPLGFAYTHFGDALVRIDPPVLNETGSEAAMEPTHKEALKEAMRLSELDHEALFHELGVRIEDAKRPGGEGRMQAFSGEFLAPDKTMSWSVLAVVGRRWWEAFEPQLMALVCDSKNEDMQRITASRSIPEVAAGLVGAGVMALAPPAWAIVAATVLAGMIVDSGLQAICTTWGERASSAPKPKKKSNAAKTTARKPNARNRRRK